MTKTRQKIPFLSAFLKNPAVRRFLLFLRYGIFARPFFSRQITISAQKQISFNIDYIFARHKYEELGERHNAGFVAWVKHCQGKKVVFDIGAHIGLYAIPASRVIASGGQVIAFEPSSANNAYLRRHLQYNHCTNVSIEPSLVGETVQRETDFYECLDPDPMNAVVLRGENKRYQKVLRQQITLDDFCQRRAIFPDIIKMDIEGAELKALKGARQLLRTRHPLIFLSVHPDRMELLGDSTAELKKLLQDLGYSSSYPDGRPAEDLKFGEYLFLPGA